MTSPGSSDSLAPLVASIPRRTLALFADAAVVTGLIFLAVVILSAAFGDTVTFHHEASLAHALEVDTGMVVLNAVVGTLISAGYFVVPWVTIGASPGQLVFGVRVGDDGGGRLTLRQAALRWILLFPPFAVVSILTTGVAALGVAIWVGAAIWYFVLLLTASRSGGRGLHDQLAGSTVRTRGAGAAPGAADVR